MRFTTRSAVSASMALVVVGVATADIVYDEAVDGELSDLGSDPTFIEFGAGVNNVLFVTDPGSDRDIFSFTIAEGYELAGLVVDEFDTNNDANLAFISITPGSSLPYDPDDPDTEQMLGYALFDENYVGSDIFLEMGTAFGTIGYDGPLGPGSYTIWAQENGPSVDTWNLGFVVNQVPAPGAIAVFGLAGLAARRRRD